MKTIATSIAALCLMSNAALAEMSVSLGGNWDGKKVPKGQQCTFFGGDGATPPMKVSNLPAGTASVHAEFNDRDFNRLSRNGGHGIIGYPVSGTTADLYSVPGMTDDIPGKAKVISAARSTGRFATKGYLPPCSGGRGNRYFVEIKAISSTGEVLEKTRINIGRY